MNNYKVYFEIYGKKMVTEVNAVNNNDAKNIIREKIIFNKIECNDKENKFNSIEVPDSLKKIFKL